MGFGSLTERLAAAGVVAAGEEAAEFVGAAPDSRTLESWVRRRERGEPLPWITGRVLFCGRWLRAAPGVYVPRAQTEELARRAARRLPPGGVAVDLCTGGGAVAAHMAAEVPAARVVGVEIDPVAARCARANGVQVVVGDLALPLRVPVDVVIAVAPYVPTGELRFLPADVQRYEPAAALNGGTDGLDVVRRVVQAAARLLCPGGWLLLELGGEQDAALAADLARHGFTRVETWHDEEGDLRGLAAATDENAPAATSSEGHPPVT